MLGRIHKATAFWIGDWINYGEAAYGEMYAQAVDDLGLDPQTLMNYASVCRRVAGGRRRSGISFSHHAEVASLDPEEQTHWLDQAEAERWSRSELRLRLRNLPLAVSPSEGVGLAPTSVAHVLSEAADNIASLTAGVPPETLREIRKAVERVVRELDALAARSEAG